MSTVTASPGTAVTRHRLTRTLPRATASAGALAAAATAGAAVLRGGGVALHLLAAAIIVPVLARHAD